MTIEELKKKSEIGLALWQIAPLLPTDIIIKIDKHISKTIDEAAKIGNGLEELDEIKVHSTLDKLEKRMKYPGSLYRAKEIVRCFGTRKPEIDREKLMKTLTQSCFHDLTYLSQEKAKQLIDAVINSDIWKGDN